MSPSNHWPRCPGGQSSHFRDTIANPEPRAARLPDPTRRAILATAVVASTTAGWMRASEAAPPVDDAHTAFFTVSQILTGYSSLHSDQSSRLHEALVTDNPKFPDQVRALSRFLDQRQGALQNLQQDLDSQHAEFAGLPRQIVKAWYTGIVGDGEKARCVTFETALMNTLVSDKLVPPSYCYGAYGSWSLQSS